MQHLIGFAFIFSPRPLVRSAYIIARRATLRPYIWKTRRAGFEEITASSLIKALGDGAMLILRNHGTLTVGADVGEMFHRMYRLERACRFQILATSGGAEINALPQEIIDHALDQGRQIYSKGGQSEGGKLVWAALKRKLDRVDPGYAV